MSAAPWSRGEGSRQETEARREGHQALLLEELEERPWATHSQKRAQFLFAALGVRVSEAVELYRSSERSIPKIAQRNLG
jgi:hypothetical protein